MAKPRWYSTPVVISGFLCQTVHGWRSKAVSGLAVTEGVGDYVGMFRITHIRSGCAVAHLSFEDAATARRAAVRLAKLTNWDRPPAALRRLKNLESKCIRAAFPGALSGERRTR